MFQENKARKIFRKTNISYPMISTRFEIRLFALLPMLSQNGFQFYQCVSDADTTITRVALQYHSWSHGHPSESLKNNSARKQWLLKIYFEINLTKAGSFEILLVANAYQITLGFWNNWEYSTFASSHNQS